MYEGGKGCDAGEYFKLDVVGGWERGVEKGICTS